jgi:hypothetical protein
MAPPRFPFNGYEEPFPGGEADHSLPYSVEVKTCRAIPPLPDTPSWRGA